MGSSLALPLPLPLAIPSALSTFPWPCPVTCLKVGSGCPPVPGQTPRHSNFHSFCINPAGWCLRSPIPFSFSFLIVFFSFFFFLSFLSFSFFKSSQFGIFSSPRRGEVLLPHWQELDLVLEPPGIGTRAFLGFLLLFLMP